MRKALIGVGIFIVVVIAGLLIFVATFDVNRYSGAIQSELEKRLGRQVALGDMHLSLFPPRFRVQNPGISDDPRFSKDVAFVKAQELDVSVKLLPLLRKDVQIGTVNLQRPVVNLIKNAAGTWNLASLGTTEREQPAPASGTSEEQQFSLNELTITDGQISVLDQSKGKTPSVYDHIDITLRNLSQKTAFTVDAAVRLAGSSQEAKLSGEGGPIVNSNPAAT